MNWIRALLQGIALGTLTVAGVYVALLSLAPGGW